MASKFIEALDRSCMGFLLGWAVSGGCQAGGRLYTTVSKAPVNGKWLGHCVTPAFQRQLAIGTATAFFVAPLAWDIARERWEATTRKCDVIAILAATGAVALTTRCTSEKAFQVLRLINLAYASARITYEGLCWMSQKAEAPQRSNSTNFYNGQLFYVPNQY